MKLHKLLALLVALMVLVSAIPSSAFAEMGGDFPWTDTDSEFLIEEILKRDGFIDGIWFPWIDGGRCGHNLTGNDVMAEYYNTPNGSGFIDWNSVELDRRGADTIYRQIYNLKAMGYNIMAYAGSIYGEGVIYDQTGDVLGIKQEYLDNARRLLNMCREIGMPVMWNVYFHCSTTPDYYGIDGWNITCRMLGDPTVADHYAQRFVKPLCQMLAEYPDVVAMVSIADEPENEINDSGMGNNFSGGRAMYGVTQEDMVYFMQQINETVRRELPGVARTVASNYGNKAIYRDFDLDMIGHHEYNNNCTVSSVANMMVNAQPILSEYNVGGDVFFSDDEYADKLIAFRENMMAEGYKGGFQWCWLPGGSGSSWAGYLLRNGSDSTSFRKTVSLLKYYMDEYRAAYRGETITLDTPVLYANAGDGRVKFIPSKRATTITIQRSDDGGNTWKDLVTNQSQSTYVDNYLIGTYTDTTGRPSGGYCYRIIATDGVHTVTSAPNNLAGTENKFKKAYVTPTYRLGKCYQYSTQSSAKLTSFGVEKNRPAKESYNLIADGSFETGTGRWTGGSFLQYASVVTDATTPDGDKSLYFNTSGKSSAGWYTFTISGLKTHTEYTFSSWLKGAYLAQDNKGMASLGVMDPDSGKFMVYGDYYYGHQRASRDTQQLYPTAWDDEWHLRSVSFNSGYRTSVTIALYGYGSRMWIDGLALYESVNGIKYENGESAAALVSTNWVDLRDSVANAVEDPRVDNTAYWESGAGYKMGFVQARDGALLYTESADRNAVRYTKWFDVKPGTEYYVSFTVNVTKAGGGRVALLDNAKTLPNEVVKVSFATAGTYTYKGCISTGAHTQLGLSVVDLGGEATIDDIYFCEGGKSAVAPTEVSFDGYVVNGTFDTGTYSGWENLWNTNTVTMVAGHDSRCAIQVNAKLYSHVRQFVTVEPNTDYVVEVWTKEAVSSRMIIKNGPDTRDIESVSIDSGSQWKKTTVEFNSGDEDTIIITLMGNAETAYYTADDVRMYKKVVESNDGFIVNGTFDTGNTKGWENLYGTNHIQMVGGYNSDYAISVVASRWSHVRQLVPVKPNTEYVIELWSKNAVNATLLVKDGADTYDILLESMPSGSEWGKTTATFYSGNLTSVYVSLMGTDWTSSYVADAVKMYEKGSVDLQNGDFESGDAHWAYTSGEHSVVTDAHGGTGALQLQIPKKSETASQTVAVEPGTVYTVTWWYKTSSSWVTLDLAVVDGVTQTAMAAVSGATSMKGNSGSWKMGTYVVRSGKSTSMTLKFVNTSSVLAGDLLIDDVTVTKQERYVCTHSYGYSGYQSPTCGAEGVRIYACSYCGDEYKEPVPASGAHTYDDVCDTTCNACGGVRTPLHQYSHYFDTDCNRCGVVRAILSPISFAGTSVSEEKNGLAFHFDVAVRGMKKENYTAIYDNATIGGCKLLGMGVQIYNDYDAIDIPCVNLLSLEKDTVGFAARIIEIPAFARDMVATATPYIVLEIDGVATTIYGEAQTCTYNEAVT